MSGTAEPVRPPKTDQEWARDTSRRLDSAENQTSVRIGPWVLSTSPDGHLIASHVEGGSTIVARKPEGVENDPDAITDETTVPSVCVTLAGTQTLASGGSTVVWDGTRLEVGGNWTGGKAPLDGVIVPVSGVYLATASVHFKEGGALFVTVIQVDGTSKLYGRESEASGGAAAWCTGIAVGHIPLTAGQKVSVLAACSAGVTIGAETITGVPVPSELSLSLVQRSV